MLHAWAAPDQTDGYMATSRGRHFEADTKGSCMTDPGAGQGGAGGGGGQRSLPGA